MPMLCMVPRFVVAVIGLGHHVNSCFSRSAAMPQRTEHVFHENASSLDFLFSRSYTHL